MRSAMCPFNPNLIPYTKEMILRSLGDCERRLDDILLCGSNWSLKQLMQISVEISATLNYTANFWDVEITTLSRAHFQDVLQL